MENCISIVESKCEKEIFSPEIICANAMFRASSNMNLMEKRALNAFISNLDMFRYESGKMAESYNSSAVIPIDDFIRVMGFSGFRRFDALREIKDVCLSLMERVVDVSSPELQSRGGFHYVHWVEECRVTDDCEYVEYRLSNALAGWFLYLKRNFAVIRLSDETKFRKYASYRFYELFVAEYGVRGGPEDMVLSFSFEDLRDMFDMDDRSARKSSKTVRYIKPNGSVDANGLRRFVIEPAMEEINRYTCFNVGVRYLMSGRRYTGVSFNVSAKPKVLVPERLRKFLENELVIMGMDIDIAVKLTEEYSPARIYFSLHYVRNVGIDKIQNIPGYLFRLIKDESVEILTWEDPATRRVVSEFGMRYGGEITAEMLGIFRAV